MQAQGRSFVHRRSPGSPGPPPNVPVRSISPGVGVQPRSSTASTRSVQSNSSRRQNREVSEICAAPEPSVTAVQGSSAIAAQHRLFGLVRRSDLMLTLVCQRRAPAAAPTCPYRKSRRVSLTCLSRPSSSSKHLRNGPEGKQPIRKCRTSTCD